MGSQARDRGDDAAAVTHLHRAVQLYDTWRAAPLAARARGELGVALVRSGEPDRVVEGWQLIEEARATFISLRATAWLEALDAELDPVTAGLD